MKQSLRSMKRKERAAWLALLEPGSFTITGKPPKKWLKAAEAAFPRIGRVAFRRRFVAWFEPFSSADALRLTVAGRNVLRVLIWTALVAKDPAVDEALAGFSKAKLRYSSAEKVE